MHSEVASEIWSELKRYINTVDRAEAAEVLISTLVNYDEDVEDIRDAFKGDSDVKKALVAYLDNDNHEEDDEEEEEYDEDYNEDWED
jgi:hypothetical protein